MPMTVSLMDAPCRFQPPVEESPEGFAMYELCERQKENPRQGKGSSFRLVGPRYRGLGGGC